MAAIKPRIKSCALCGQPFTATGSRQKICSPECAIAFNCLLNEKTGCWEKQGPYRGQRGYTAIQHKGEDDYGHRFSYRLLVGEIPEGLVVRHSCDNPCCVNPDHLQLGTHEQNMQDMRTRGRSMTGARNNQARPFP